ncbi:MAG: TlpA family protein disulfide reductase [Clostridia bacterium]|nr:TlpA family protein disulfide reductase [Clostridia bacterium]
MKKKWKLYPTNFKVLLGIIILFAIFALYQNQKQYAIREVDDERVPRLAEFFSGESFDGEEITSDIFAKNKLTMIDVWATTCTACVADMPHLAAMEKKYASQGFQVIGVCADLRDKEQVKEERVDTAREIQKKTGVSYMQLIPSEEFQKEYLRVVVTATPHCFMVNQKGEIVETHVGAIPEDALAEKIEQCLKESE